MDEHTPAKRNSTREVTRVIGTSPTLAAGVDYLSNSRTPEVVSRDTVTHWKAQFLGTNVGESLIKAMA